MLMMLYKDLFLKSCWTKPICCCFSQQQGHMKTHPGALTAAPSKAQTNDNDTSEDQSSNSAKKEEKQVVSESPEKGVRTDPPPISVGSDEASEPTDATA